MNLMRYMNSFVGWIWSDKIHELIGSMNLYDTGIIQMNSYNQWIHLINQMNFYNQQIHLINQFIETSTKLTLGTMVA